MILYLDTSALIKRYVAEAGSEDVNDWIEAAEVLITGQLTRVEVAAAINRLLRMKLIKDAERQRALELFHEDWDDLVRHPLTETTIQRAENLTNTSNLRAYDAVHLATALIWQETTLRPIYMVTYDRELWQASRAEGLQVLPEKVGQS
jgi:predicted nucleic acid-binding protein